MRRIRPGVRVPWLAAMIYTAVAMPFWMCYTIIRYTWAFYKWAVAGLAKDVAKASKTPQAQHAKAGMNMGRKQAQAATGRTAGRVWTAIRNW